jgi:hypothetical protein
MARPKIDHMKRLDLQPHASACKDGKGYPRNDVEIVGRRSRKVWTCAAGDLCAVGLPIDLDEVYIEHAQGTCRYTGKCDRYHVACAITGKIVFHVEHPVDRGNSRRQAVLAQRARGRANAN